MEISHTRIILKIENEYLKKSAAFLGKFVGKAIYTTVDFSHKILDKVFAWFLYLAIRSFGKLLFYAEAKLYEYLKHSKYVKSDQFEKKIDEDKLIMLGMGLMDTHKITLREISYSLNISDFYARRVKHIAKKWPDYFNEYKRIMKEYESDSEKKDKRSEIAKKRSEEY